MNALQAHELLSDLLRESPERQPPWLQSLRGQALDSFCRLGFPSRKQEDWKYTDVQSFLKADYHPQRMSCIGLLPEDIEHLFIADADVARVVFVNGWFTPQLSRLPAPASGVDIASLAQVLEQRPQQLQGQLGNTADNEAHGFNAMNTAALNDGLYLHVEEGIQADTAIHLLYLTTASDGLLSLPRNLIRVDAGARAVVIEHYASLGEARTLTDTVSEIVLGEDAALEFYCLQMESMASSHIASQYVTQEMER
ncbi:MAG: SufD family Fe-S cluster assembly protein [Pseudomonadota bacterium]|nr:SufD family Fe-S cluster assembly protein [Pseudomonadota bacterium]